MLQRNLLITIMALLSISFQAYAQDIYAIPICDFYESGDYVAFVSQGDYGYAATRYGFKVYDISDRDNPLELANIPTNGICNNLAVKDDYAFISDSEDGVLVYDISDPVNPIFKDSINPAGTVRTICPYNSEYFFATEEDFGLDIIDYSNPENLSIANHIYPGGMVFDAVVYDHWLYLSIGIAGIAVYDIQQPASPEFQMIWNTLGGNTKGLHVYPDGSHLLAADFYNGTHILDLEFPWIPTHVATIQDTVGFISLDVCGGDGFGVTSYAHQGISSFDLDGTLLDYYYSGWSTTTLMNIDEYTYLCRQDSGLMVFNCEDPSNILLSSHLKEPFRPTMMHMNDDILYLGGMSGGVHVVDVSVPSNPQILDTITTPWANGVAVTEDNQYLYIGDFWEGIKIYDISNPSQPQYVNSVATVPDEGSTQITVRGDYLYDSIWMVGLNIFDISDPENPLLVYSAPDSTEYFGSHAFTQDNQNMFVTCFDNGIQVYSLASPDTAVLEYTITDMFNIPEFISINGSFGYVTTGGEWAYIIDVSNPYYVFKFDSLTENTNVSSAGAINDSILFFSKHNEGFSLYDIGNMSEITKINEMDTPGYVYGGVLSDSILFVTDYYQLLIYGLSSTGIGETIPQGLPADDFTMLYPPVPNPFNHEAILSYYIDRPGNAALTVYNINGERVTELAEGYHDKGKYSLKFNVQNLSSGVYFARLETKSSSHTQKMLFIK